MAKEDVINLQKLRVSLSGSSSQRALRRRGRADIAMARHQSFPLRHHLLS